MTTDLARQEPQALAYRHELTLEEIVSQAKKITDVIRTAMEEGVHYGRIQGTQKPTLLKPGAEKLCLLFRLDPQYQSVETFSGEHLSVKSVCTLWHIPTGQRFGSGEGSCSTLESKYAWRWRGQGPTRERVPNPDLADQYNTVLKMANKRALVAAVLNCTAASDVFTQDLEDEAEPSEDRHAAPPTTAPAATGVISAAQLKRLHAVASASKWSEAQAKTLLAAYGYTSSTDVTLAHYETLVERLKLAPPAA